MPICRLQTKQDIESLIQKIRFFDRPASFRVELLCTSTLSPVRKHQLEKRLAFALLDCGCALASFSIILTTLILYYIFDFPFLPISPNLTTYLVSVITIAIIAKLVSLYLSYRMAHNIIQEILSSLMPGRQSLVGLQ